MKIQFPVSLLSVLVILLAACTNAAPATGSPTAVPATATPTRIPPTATISPTAVPATATPTQIPPTEEPTQTEEPTPTEFAPNVGAFPDLGNADLFGGEQPAGPYKPPASFSIPFIFETDKAYRGMYEGFVQAQLFGLAQGPANYPPTQLLFWAINPSYSVDEAISQLHSTSGMVSTEIEAATLAGISGLQFDAVAEQVFGIPALAEFVGHAGDSWHTNSPSVHLRFIALAISDRTLLIYIEAPQADFDAFIADVNAVLITIAFAP